MRVSHLLCMVSFISNEQNSLLNSSKGEVGVTEVFVTIMYKLLQPYHNLVTVSFPSLLQGCDKAVIALIHTTMSFLYELT